MFGYLSESQWVPHVGQYILISLIWRVQGFNHSLNIHVRDAHTEARHAYVTWRDNGKPRQGPVCELMRTTYTLRQCQTMEESSRAEQSPSHTPVKTWHLFGSPSKRCTTNQFPWQLLYMV